MTTLQRSLIYTILTSLMITGCSWAPQPDTPRSSILEDLPFVYRMTVQQGNIVTEEMVDRLELGMTKNQVRYLLGTPVLVDFFRDNRWDYTYTNQRGSDPMKIRELTLFFEDDLLTRIQGDLRPDSARARAREPEEMVVAVPDHAERKGFFSRRLEAVGIGRGD